MSDSDIPSAPASFEAMFDAVNREGYYESALKVQTKRLESVYRELDAKKRALVAAEQRLVELVEESGEWSYLAFKYGTRTEAERRTDTMTLNGSVVVARGLIDQGPDEAINYACADLAKKLRRAIP